MQVVTLGGALEVERLAGNSASWNPVGLGGRRLDP